MGQGLGRRPAENSAQQQPRGPSALLERVRAGKGVAQGSGARPPSAPTRRCKRLQRRQRRWLRLQWRAVRICRLRTHPTGEKRTHFTDTSPPGGKVNTHPPTRRQTGRRDRHGHGHTRGEKSVSNCISLHVAPQCKIKLRPRPGFVLQFVVVT